MKLPEQIQQHLAAGTELFQSACVQTPLFSRGTYHIEVTQKQSSYFPFLQLQDDGSLLDSFCTCKLSESGFGCPHLTAAYLRILNGTQFPLHVRFRESLWNQLFLLCSKKMGYKASALQGEGKTSFFLSKTKKKLFSIALLNQNAEEKFRELTMRPEETEETSLKFSNLSAEELANWRAGKGSPELLYELSFWSDLAKWTFSLVDTHQPYTIAFAEDNHHLPREMTIAFPDLILWFYISDVNWPQLIPTLASVHSPLPVFDGAESSLESVAYDEEARCLRIVHREKGQDAKDPHLHGHSVGQGWIYVPRQGFYRKQTARELAAPLIPAEKIAETLNMFHPLLRPLLSISPQPFPAKYQLSFDAEGRLHIELYVLRYKDMQAELSHCYPPWAYVAEEKTFYLLEEWMFEGKEKVLEKEGVAEFVNQHRVWLFQFPGFETHLGSLEARLTYEVNEKKQLVFGAKLDYPDHFADTIDFGQWVYIKGQGFYTKKESQGRFFLHPGLTIEPQAIASFIESHREDLEQIERFYSAQCPLITVGLDISLTEGQEIVIAPRWEYAACVNPSEVQFFGPFVYHKNRGFSELPHSMRLPERYREPITVSSSGEAPFLAYELEPLKPWIAKIDPRLTKPASLNLKVRKIIHSKRSKQHQWLIDLIYESEIGWVDPFAIWDAFQGKKRHLFSPAGLLSLKDPRFNWIRQLTRKQLDRTKGVIRLNMLEWIRLSVFEEIKLPATEEAAETKNLLEQMDRFETNQLLDLSKLKASLRPYQETGLHWLWFLYCYRLSGLLCDDMGLGKTHQAMALLAAISQGDLELQKKYLVVCPTSVIYHWQELLKTFLPDIRVCTYYGVARSLDSFAEHFDLLLTSYGILRTGKEDLRAFSFELAIFDEIQTAKNQASQTHAALRNISATMRLGLTGTPIENHLRELKALFDIVLPGYMPSDVVFRDLFETPIEKERDEKQKALLTKLIKPFILRRKKSEVLLDLPEKTETIAYCDLSAVQKTLYQEIATSMRNTVYKDLCDETKPVPYIHVFSALSTLKRICDHPALIAGHTGGQESGKWDLFLELLSEARASGQKIVVFSQYLEMLALIEKYLRKKGIGFATIKGSTRDRSTPLQRFRDDPACEVFVASLLAAGVGIDLTVASVVIHYDRWWNPAKENQATDRVHRLGQSRGVQVFKLVTKHTIEEHIHNLIEKKKYLMEEIVGYDEAAQIQILNRDELISLFQEMFKELEVNKL